MPRPRTRAMMLGAGLPTGYLVAKHVGWQPDTDGKKRMLLHQLTFWTSLAAGLFAMHRIKRKRWKDSLKMLACALAAAPAIAAFEGGSRLASWLIPYRTKGLQAGPSSPSRYVPPFLQSAGTSVHR